MINRLSNPINRNRSAAKISKVMSSSPDVQCRRSKQKHTKTERAGDCRLEECVAQHEHTQSSTAKHKTPTCCESGIYRERPGSFKKLNAVRGM